MAWKQLSFADRLNLALFVLTIMAVAFAAWSLRVAQETLDDAKETGRHEQERFNKQMRSSDQQFQQQTSQSALQFKQQTDQEALQFKHENKYFSESLAALVNAKNELQQEATLLIQLQNTSKLQLEALSQQTEMQLEVADIRPLPALAIECARVSILKEDRHDSVWAEDLPRSSKSFTLGPLEESTQGWISVHCATHMSAEGRVPVNGATLSVISHSGALLNSRLSDNATLKHSIDIFSNQTISPKRTAGERTDFFDVEISRKNAQVQLEVIFQSINGGRLDRLIWISAKTTP
jgi:hypothetical protein